MSQDLNDEPFEFLLNSIEMEKREFSGGNPRIAAGSPLSDVTLPEGWGLEYLEELVLDFKNGFSKRNSDVGVPTPVIRLADVSDWRELTDSRLRNIRLEPSELKKYGVSEGDVLVIRVNGSQNLVGRFVPCRIQKQWAYSDHLIRIKLPERLNPEYLCLFANCEESRAHIRENTITTAGQNTINQKGLGRLLVKVPPLAEQRRLVAEVNLLMGLCDELESKLRRAVSEGKRLADAIVDSLTQ